MRCVPAHQSNTARVSEPKVAPRLAERGPGEESVQGRAATVLPATRLRIGQASGECYSMVVGGGRLGPRGVLRRTSTRVGSPVAGTRPNAPARGRHTSAGATRFWITTPPHRLAKRLWPVGVADGEPSVGCPAAMARGRSRPDPIKQARTFAAVAVKRDEIPGGPPLDLKKMTARSYLWYAPQADQIGRKWHNIQFDKAELVVGPSSARQSPSLTLSKKFLLT